MKRRLRFMWYKHDSVDSEHIALMNWNFIKILVLTEKVKIWFVTSAVIEKELFVAQKMTLNRAGMKTCT